MIRLRVSVAVVLAVLAVSGQVIEPISRNSINAAETRSRAVASPPPQGNVLPLTGPYLGQTPPGRRPEVFAPAVVSTGDRDIVHASIAVSPDGAEIVWSFFHESDRTFRTWWSRRVNGRWTAPGRPPFASGGDAASLSFAPDGRRLFFTSNRRWPAGQGAWPGPRALDAQKIWYIERAGTRWSDPRMLDLPVVQRPLSVSPAASGALYTAGIRRIPVVGGGYGTPERLPPPLHNKGWHGGNHPFVAPDESYIVFNDVWRGHQGYGIFVSYRLPSGGWSDPVNLCEILGMQRGGSEPTVSPDGRYLLFYSDHNVYWVDASVIEERRPVVRTPGFEETR